MSKIRVLPHNDEAERSVLGSILIDKDAINIVSERLGKDSFYNEANCAIYECMLTLYEKRKPIDLLTLGSELKRKKINTIDSDYITSLIESVPTAANVEHYIQIVKDAYVRRSLIRNSGEVAELAYEEDNGIKDVLDKAESSLFSISQGNLTRGFIPLKDTLTDSFDRIDELHRSGAGLRGVKTGFSDLDNLLSGMQKSNLLILAARPGTGKTAIMLNIAQHIGIKEKIGVGIFSLEMSKEELVDRFLISQADIDAWRLKTGRLSEADFTNLSGAMGMLADSQIFIDDTPGLSIMEMRSKARRLQMEHNVGIFIVDYLQLVAPDRKYESRVQEVSAVSQALKNLARELNLPVLAASQLSRAVEHRGEKKPQLADLRESGAIEQDADVVMFLYRPEAEITGPSIQTKLLVAKHRNGPTDEIDLLFRGDRIRFFSVSKNQTV